jgi:hypothetical protein
VVRILTLGFLTAENKTFPTQPRMEGCRSLCSCIFSASWAAPLGLGAGRGGHLRAGPRFCSWESAVGTLAMELRANALLGLWLLLLLLPPMQGRQKESGGRGGPRSGRGPEAPLAPAQPRRGGCWGRRGAEPGRGPRAPPGAQRGCRCLVCPGPWRETGLRSSEPRTLGEREAPVLPQGGRVRFARRDEGLVMIVAPN